MGAEWSLGRQSAIWFGGLLAVLAVVLVGLVYLMTLRFVAGKLDEEVREIASFAAAELRDKDAERSVGILELLVAENQQLDVLIELRGDAVAELIGDETLLRAGAGRFERRLRVPVGDGRELTVTIDGTEWKGPLTEYLWAMGSLVAAFALVFLVASWLFGRKVSDLLASVARSVEESGRPSTPRGAPREIADVTRAVSAEFDKLEATRSRIQLLIAGAAHELRSPVQSMLSRVQVTMRRSLSESQHREMLSGQERELVDLARKVDNLVLLSSDPEDRLPVESFDWPSELQLRLGSDIARARQHGVDVRFEGPDSVLIEGNRESLMLAVRNLVSNAVSFSEAGQRVTVTTAVLEEGDVAVTVDDEGPGVAEQERGNVFEAFRRGTRRERSGYGLGLALVRRAMLDHGGRVWVEDAPSGGARFALEFPSAYEPDAPGPARESPRSG